MEKRRKLVFVAAPVTCLVILLSLLLTDFLSFHQWMQDFSEKEQYQQPWKHLLARLVRGRDRRQLEATGYGCDIAEDSIVCLASKPVRIDTHITGKVAVYVSSGRRKQEETTVKPYTLQKDKYLLQYISPVNILHGKNNQPACDYNHEIPAVIFSSGIVGNLFHEFNNIIIPLYITTKHFRTRVMFILEDYNPQFVTKYTNILSRLSSFDVMDPSVNKSVHCFPSMVLGLKYHGNLALNPGDLPRGYSMNGFRMFLQVTYNLKYTHVSQIMQPRIMLVSREKTRKFLNEDEVVSMIQQLGFHVIVARTQEAENISKFANTVNSCSVLVGAHGAGLTNELFLPAGAVTVQVEPLGLQWASDNYFGSPAHAMNVQYLKYKIEPEESSLTKLYGRNHTVITDPESIYAKGYRTVRAIYIDQQNIRVDIARFRKMILQATELLKVHHQQDN